MSRRESGGQSPDSQDRSFLAEHAGAIEETDLAGMPKAQMSGSAWDRVLVGLFVVALLGGVGIAVGNVLTDTPTDDTVIAVPTTTARPTPTAAPGPPNAWLATAVGHANEIGHRFAYSCPPGGASLAGVWGTRMYRHDSSICAAAVHWGVITLADGGTVFIWMRPGRDFYRGTRRNGITSRSYRLPWCCSFVFYDGS